MKASELRIGNMVFYSGVVLVIESLGEKEINGCSACSLKNMIPIKYERLQPIPLTEEWLVKSGFENEDGIGLLKWPIGCSRSAEGYLMVFDAKNKSQLNGRYHYELFDNDIKYVHQLQNLYFALTGEELTIKE